MDKDITNEIAEIIDDAKPAVSKFRRNHFSIFFRLILIAVPIIVVYFTFQAYHNSDSVIDRFYGEILKPKPGAAVPRTFTVEGITKNIPPEHPHVILAVDVENLRLCWPKHIGIQPNTRFRAKIHENGPAGKFTLALYAVDERHYQMVKDWWDAKRVGGMSLLPMRFKVGSIDLLVR